MAITIVIILTLLLLLAYVFDISSSKTKIPSVILLLFMGWGVKQLTNVTGINFPELTPILPILGTVGLVLIVLEGAFELELNKSKLKLIFQSLIMAVSPLLIMSFVLALALQYFGNIPFRLALINAIPFAVISSAIAIPSVRNYCLLNKEFITYESSFSDIIGIIFFNFISLNEVISYRTFGNFIFDILIILLVSFFSIGILAYLLSKIKHHVKFIPIILIIVLLFAILEYFHLPALLMIIFFGLFLGNFAKLKNIKYFKLFQPEILEKEIIKFKELAFEMVFLIRALFFILFGFLLENSEILNLVTLYWAMLITLGIFSIRAIHLSILRLPLQPLLFVAPRGLITILLFLSIPVCFSSSLVNKSLVIQVIVLTATVLMFGSIFSKKKELQLSQIKLPHTDNQ